MQKVSTQIILDYEFFYNTTPSPNRLELIKDLNLRSILVELCRLNLKMKQKNKLHIDISLDTQLNEVYHFASKEDSIKFFNYSKNVNKNCLVFNRYATLVAIEEILSIDNLNLLDESEGLKPDDWSLFFKYYLAINYEITQITIDDKPTLESLNSKSIFVNESMIFTDPIYTPFRAIKLFEFILKDSELKDSFVEYIMNEYKIEPFYLILRILGFITYDKGDNLEHHFYYTPKDEDIYLFEALSKRSLNIDSLKLIGLKKAPFIKIGEAKFLLTDLTLLIEKLFNQVYSDFWFDFLKYSQNHKITKYDTYRSKFGKFMEIYVNEIMDYTYRQHRHYKVFAFDELKIQKNKIEFIDIYLRCNNKILLGEVKSGMISDDSKIGGDLSALYKSNRDAFFKRFGLNQLVNAINTIDINAPLFDFKFESKKVKEIYPIIIVNDKIFQTPFMNHIFSTRFSEMVLDSNLTNHKIYPLTIIHINDLERLENSLHYKPNEIWKILELNFNKNKLIPPFHITVSKNWGKRDYSKRLYDEFEKLILKYTSVN